MPTTDTVITARTSSLTSWATPLIAALLAADASAPDGFRPQDVRFFFLLASNWMGDDHLRPGADLDATQVRRTLQHLAKDGFAAPLCSGRAPQWSLTVPGVLRLVEVLTEPTTARRFEEVVLLAMVAASYADVIAARVRRGGRGEERRVRARLDPVVILRAERRRLHEAMLDLESRREAGPAMAAAARKAREEGATPLEVAARLEAEGRLYQLHPMRPLHELMAALPSEVQRFEIERGLELRAKWMFTPLAENLRAQIAVLERLESRISQTVRG